MDHCPLALFALLFAKIYVIRPCSLSLTHKLIQQTNNNKIKLADLISKRLDSKCNTHNTFGPPFLPFVFVFGSCFVRQMPLMCVIPTAIGCCEISFLCCVLIFLRIRIDAVLIGSRSINETHCLIPVNYGKYCTSVSCEHSCYIYSSQ